MALKGAFALVQKDVRSTCRFFHDPFFHEFLKPSYLHGFQHLLYQNKHRLIPFFHEFKELVIARQRH